MNATVSGDGDDAPLHRRSLAAHARALRRGDYSSVELTRHFLARIAAAGALNAFITVTEDVALKQAAEADRRLADGDGDGDGDGAAAALLGIPVAHKDLFCTDGVLTTCGSKILSNFVAPYNATVVDKLHRSGMVMLGKTNMDEFAMGSSNETSFYGPARNPWDAARVPGGSSGGSAAAVAARLVPIATGSDTGGSIRQPAALCGLTGVKPSYGRVSRRGMVAFASSLDQAGVLAVSAADAAVVLRAMAGFDAGDSTSLQRAVPDYPALLSTATGAKPLAGKTIGLPVEFFGPDVDAGVADCITVALDELRKLGAKTVEVELPNSAAGIPCYYVLAPAEASSNLARFDGARYGHRAARYADLDDMYARTRGEGFGAEVKRRIMVGAFVLSSGYYDAYYLKAQKLRRLIADDFARAFEVCDLLAGPTTPAAAFKLGEKTRDPVAMYLNDIFTNAVNLAGLPALSAPAGFDRAGLPVGLQLIGKYMDEATPLAAAHAFQTATDWHRQTPPEYS